MAAGVACRSSTGPLARRDLLERLCRSMRRDGAMIFVGIDWAEAHHDVCVLDRRRGGAGDTADPRGPRGCGPTARAARRPRRGARRGGRRHRDRPGPARDGPAGRGLHRCMRSTRSPRPAIGSATPRVGPSPTGLMRGCSRTSCAPTGSTIGGGSRQRAAWRHQGPRAGPPEPHLDPTAPDERAAQRVARVLPRRPRRLR